MIKLKNILNEAKTFKPGDMWSKDFDYVGMMKYASKVHLMTGFGYLKKLYDSLEDVNYHSENKHLGMAIDAIENGQKNKAEKHLKAFNKAAKKTLKSVGPLREPWTTPVYMCTWLCTANSYHFYFDITYI